MDFSLNPGSTNNSALINNCGSSINTGRVFMSLEAACTNIKQIAKELQTRSEPSVNYWFVAREG